MVSHPLNKDHVTLLQPNIPQQNNGFDCGVYYLKFGHLLKSYMEEYFSIDDQDQLELGITELLMDFDVNTIIALRVNFKKELDLLAASYSQLNLHVQK